MKSVIVSGANRGLGFGLVKYLALSVEPKIEFVFAGYRQKDKSQELFDFGEKHKNVIPIKLDVTDDESIENARSEIQSKLGNQNGLNMLINNAAVNNKLKFKDINEKDMMECYKQNVIGPWKLTKAFLPLLEKSVSGARNVLQSSVIMIGSIMSSVEIAPSLPDFHYDYQCSKAALNMLTVCMAKDLDKTNIFMSLIHPGWVRTDMGSQKAALSVDEASKNIIECIHAMKNEHHAKLIDSRNGKQCTRLPW